mmetsp:Transcript_17228/g.52262  ORF Transcript_17228/g.52262 Transcript_17228/m.52262 type:complete len:205 (+) Transcript_17228:6-620(+)
MRSPSCLACHAPSSGRQHTHQKSSTHSPPYSKVDSDCESRTAPVPAMPPPSRDDATQEDASGLRRAPTPSRPNRNCFPAPASAVTGTATSSARPRSHCSHSHATAPRLATPSLTSSVATRPSFTAATVCSTPEAAPLLPSASKRWPRAASAAVRSHVYMTSERMINLCPVSRASPSCRSSLLKISASPRRGTYVKITLRASGER